MALEIVEANSRRDREQFLRLPWRLYEDFPGWVPNLLTLQRSLLSEKKNPFFGHGRAQLFLAVRDGEPVGRVSAQIDERHNQQHDERTGFFGFFESVDDAATARALLGAAEGWLTERGMDTVRGPSNFSLHEGLGLMIEGFDQPAMIMMPQTLPCYPALVEAAGYRKAQDLLAYRWQIKEPPPRIKEAVERTRSASGLTLRTVSKRRLHQEVDVLLDIYLDAFSDNWGYVPVTRGEAQKFADDLRLIGDSRLAIIAELDGEPIAMVIGVPNLYEVIRDFNGFIDPLKAVKLVWRLKIRGPESGRIILFGVKKAFRRRRALLGLPFLLLHQLYENALTRHYRWCEESWVLETNSPMIALLPYWDAYVYKRYRVYEKALAP
jgi:hypothetical protein